MSIKRNRRRKKNNVKKNESKIDKITIEQHAQQTNKQTTTGS
jgi:hypothetical protein